MSKVAVFAPVIHTPRLAMTLYNPEMDAQFLYELLTLGIARSPVDPDWKLEDFLQMAKNITLSPSNCLGLTAPGPAIYIVRLGDANGERIGQISLCERRADIAPDFGYTIVPAYHRQGYGTEAATAVKKYWLDFGIKEMTGFCSPLNEASNAMLVKLGFVRAGQALANEKIVANAYALPGMKPYTVETARFNWMGDEK